MRARLALSFSVLALVCAAGPVWAGVSEGLDAYGRKDWSAAVREFEPEAKAGDRTALSRLGHLKLHGLGTARDVTGAVDLLTKAAEQGDSLAQNTLGGLYFRGTGVPKNVAQALVWFSRAADQNQPNALNNLGQLYFSGNGIAKDEAKALEYFRRAADLGISASWEGIGIAYWNGRGIGKDRKEAVRWLKKAAERGHMVAQNLYGAALWGGDGIGQDRAEAVEWFKRAGDQGDGSSLFNVAQAKGAGIGVPKSLEEALYYYILAEKRAKPADKARFGEARAKAAAQCSPDQEKRAVERAAAWRPTKGKPVEIDDSPESDDGEQKGTVKKDKAPERPKMSAGSGFVVTTDGVVLTNSHVVKSCRNIKVSLGEGSQAQAASVVARDVDNDMALLKTTLKPAKAAHFRDDKPMRPGDEVVAVGFPLSSLLSREPNVTAGVVSAMNGLRGDPRHYQITAPIQRGNSGGPLTDMGGNVVGIVTSTLNAMKVAEKSGAIPQNVNFAIKSALAMKFLRDNGISYQTSPARPPKSVADVGEDVREIAAFVECEG